MEKLTNKLDNMTINNCNNTDVIDTVIQNMEAIHFRESEYNDAHINILPIIPLEVANYFGKDYFDDEDFIYQDFVLPDCIISAIQDYQHDSTEPYHTQVAEYLIGKYHDMCIIQGDNPIQPIMRNIIILYESMIHYYVITDNIGPDCVNSQNIYEFIEPGFEKILYNTVDQIINLIELNPQSDEYQTIHQYSQEVLYGLNLIIHQIKCILDTYAEHCKIYTIDAGIQPNHIKRLFRLTNNMCVIMLFFFLVHNEALDDCYPSLYCNTPSSEIYGTKRLFMDNDIKECLSDDPDGWKIGYRNDILT